MDLIKIRETKVKEYEELSQNIATCEAKVAEIQDVIRKLGVEAIKKSGEVQMIDEILASQVPSADSSDQPIDEVPDTTAEESPEL